MHASFIEYLILLTYYNVGFTCKRVRRSRFGAACAQAQGVTKGDVRFKRLLARPSAACFQMVAYQSPVQSSLSNFSLQFAAMEDQQSEMHTTLNPANH